MAGDPDDILKDWAAFPMEPPPDVVLLVCERCRVQPPSLAELGMIRVRIKMRSGAWRYDVVPEEAILAKPNGLQP